MLGFPRLLAFLSVLAFFARAVRAAPPPAFTYSNVTAPSSPDINPDIYGYVDADGDPVWVITVPADLGPWTEITLDGVSGANYIFDTSALNISQELDVVNDGTDDSTDIEIYGYDADSSLIVTIPGLSTVPGATTFLGSFLLTIYYGQTSAKVMKREVVTYQLVAAASVGTTTTGGSTASPVTSATVSPSLTTVVTESPSTTVITITSCSDNECSESTATTGYNVVTTTLEDIVTVYTTYCPLTAEGATQTKTYTPWTPAAATATTTVVVTALPEGTTTLTVTSCSDNKCEASALATGYNVVTTTLEDIVTVYTTYCPLTQYEYTETVYVTPTPTNIVVVTYTETVTVTAGTTTVYEAAEDAVKTTGYTTVTSTSEDVVVVYTTYCPLTNLKEHKFEVTYAEVTSTASVSATSTDEVSFINSRGTTVTKTAAPASATTVDVTSSVEATATVATGAAGKTTTTSASSVAEETTTSSASSVAAISALSSGFAPSVGPVGGSVLGGLVFFAALFI